MISFFILIIMIIILLLFSDTCNFNQELSGKRWSSLDLEIYNWILEELSLKDTDKVNNKYIDLYINHLKNANRNLDLIFNNKLTELFKIDYKDFVYKNKFNNKDIIVGYSSFEIDLIKIIKHYNLNNFQMDIKKFMIFNNLSLFIILSNYINTRENHSEEIKKQIIISYINNQIEETSIFNFVIKCLESIIPIAEIQLESVISELKNVESMNLIHNNCLSNLDSKPKSKSINMELSLKLFNINDNSFSRKKLEPLIKDIISNKY